MTLVELRRRSGPSLWAEVDDADAETVGAFRWHAVRNSNTFYAVRHLRVDGRKTTQNMQTFLLGQPGVDHIDGNGLNNRRSNLRLATAHQNGANRAKNRGTSSRFKGVTFAKANRHRPWVAQIQVHGHNDYLGAFADEEEAARAYDDAAIERFGQYARPNFARSDP